MKNRKSSSMQKVILMALTFMLVFSNFFSMGAPLTVSADDANGGPPEAAEAMPGGVEGVALWLDASKGVGIENDKVATWKDQTTEKTFNLDSTKTGVTLDKSGANFNPAVKFNNGLMLGEENTKINVKELFTASKHNGENIGAIFATYPKIGNRQGFFRSFSTQFANESGNVGTEQNSPTNGKRTLNSPDANGNDNLRLLGSSTKQNMAWTNGFEGTAGAEVDTGAAHKLILGRTNEDYNEGYLNGHFGELIVFNETKNNGQGLTTDELNRLNSYFALKYGITLKNAKGELTDYIASDGTTKMWTAENNEGYGNRIIGIGQDISGGLDQKQSKSADEDAKVTIALGKTIEDSNAANENTFTNDKSFFVFSDNDGEGLDRIYKVDKTDFADADITIAVDKNDDEYPTHLVVNDNDKFEDYKESYDLTDGKVTINSKDFTNGDYFTFEKSDEPKTLDNVPGGIDTQPVLWLKANDGMTSKDDKLSGWTDKSGVNNFTLDKPENSNTPTVNANGVNFNPSVKFTNPSGGGHYATSAKLLGDEKITYQSGYAVYKWPSGGSAGTLVGSSDGRYNGINILGGYNNNLTIGSGAQQTYDYIESTVRSRHKIVNHEIEDENKHSARIDGVGKDSPTQNSKKFNTFELTPVIGATYATNSGNGWSGLNAEVAEIILYDEMTSSNAAKIETYLAVKYGITLNDGKSDYVATNDDVVWKSDETYKANIAGIGRDDAQGLHQKQSQSIHEDTQVAIGLTKLKETNLNNNASLTNGQYLIWGDNGEELIFTKSIENSTDKYHAERVWKAQNTKEVGEVQVAIPAEVVGEKATLLVSKSETFDIEDEQMLEEITLNGVKYYAATVTLNDGDYFTFAVESPKLIEENGVTLDGKTITLTFDQEVEFDGNANDGFTVKVDGEEITLDKDAVKIDPNDATEVIITLLEDTDVTEDITVAYDEEAGNLQSKATGVAVDGFNEKAVDPFTDALNITRPSEDPAIVNNGRPTIEGEAAEGSKVKVAIKDKDGTEVVASEYITISEDGKWKFKPEATLPIGDYTIEVTATDGDKKVTKKRELTIAQTHPDGKAIETSEGKTSYTAHGEAIKVDKDVTLDADILNEYKDSLTGATVMIENLQEGDALQFEDTEKIKGSYNEDSGVLTLTPVEGQEPTVEDYQAAMQSVEFTTTSKNQADRDITFGLGTAFAFDENGHFYDFINKGSNITWHQAKDEAEEKSYFGRQGYLATIMSEEENSFITEKTSAKGWIGAADADRINYTNPNQDNGIEKGDWRWVTGPEGLADEGKGTPFFTGYVGNDSFGPVGNAYDNWQVENGARKEPNNYSKKEWVAHIFPAGDWNDYPPNNSVTGYVIEYGGMPHDATFAIKDTKVIEFNYKQPALETAELEQTVADDNQITLTFDQEVEFDGDANDGFAITVGEEEISLDDATFKVDPTDKTNVIITLPEGTDLAGKDVTVKYDEAEGNLQAEATGAPVESFEEKATDPFAGKLTIDEPSEEPVITAKPDVSGKSEPGSDLSVVVKDEEDNEIAGEVDVDDDGNWTFTPEGDLADGKYTIEATATKDGKKATKTKDFTVDTTLPELEVTAPEDKVSVSQPTFAGTATPGATVKVKISDDVTLEVEADEEGNWSVTPEEALADGDYEVEITAEKDGKTSEPVKKNIAIDTNQHVDYAEQEKVTEINPKEVTYDADEGKFTVPADVDEFTFTDGDKNMTATKDADDKWTFAEDVDKSKLEAKHDEIDGEGLHEDDYTPESWSELEEALNNANEVLNDPEASQDQVDKVLEDLDKARKNLEDQPQAPVVDKSALENKRDDIVGEGLHKDDYTPESWSELEEALNNANEVLNDPEASQDQVDKALEDLEKSRENLTEKKATPPSVEVDEEEYDETPTFTGKSNATEVTIELKDEKGNVVETVTVPVKEDGTWSFTPTNPLLSGYYTLAVSATIDGETVTEEVGVTIEAKPTATVTKPVENTVTTSKPEIAGTAIPGAKVTVKINDDITLETTADSDGNWSVTPTQDLPEGTNTIVVTTEKDGKTSDPVQKTIEVKTEEVPTAPEVDKSLLENYYNSVKDLEEVAYTPETWDGFATALDNAKTRLDNPDVTQEDLDEALDNLIKNHQKLTEAEPTEDVDKSALQNMYDLLVGKDLKADDYTSDSWSNYATALNDVKKTLDNPDATQDEVDQALTNLVNSHKGLKEQEAPVPVEVDKSKLMERNDAIRNENLNSGDYTTDSWKDLETALNNAAKVLDNAEATQEEVDNALAALNKAYEGLVDKPVVPTVDKSKLEALNQAIKTEDLSKDDYTTDSWKAFSDAQEHAEKVLNDPNARQAEVDAALAALDTAYKGLAAKQKVDKSKLEALNKEITKQGLSKDAYTSDSWQTFRDAQKHAEQVLADENATQKEVDDALAALDLAYKGLAEKEAEAPKVDKSKLDALNKDITKQDLSKDAYTSDSWNTFNEAQKHAKKVLADDNATQKEVDEAFEGLSKAYDGLVKKQAQKPVEKPTEKTPEKPTQPKTPATGVQVDEVTGEKLPGTATPIYNQLVFGFVILLTGLLFAFLYRRKTNN